MWFFYLENEKSYLLNHWSKFHDQGVICFVFSSSTRWDTDNLYQTLHWKVLQVLLIVKFLYHIFWLICIDSSFINISSFVPTWLLIFLSIHHDFWHQDVLFLQLNGKIAFHLSGSIGTSSRWLHFKDGSKVASATKNHMKVYYLSFLPLLSLNKANSLLPCLRQTLNQANTWLPSLRVQVSLLAVTSFTKKKRKRILKMKKREKYFNLFTFKEDKRMSVELTHQVWIHCSNHPESSWKKKDSKRYCQSCDVKLAPWASIIQNLALWISDAIAILLQACHCESYNHSVLDNFCKNISHSCILTQHPNYQSCWYDFDLYTCHIGSTINTCSFLFGFSSTQRYQGYLE